MKIIGFAGKRLCGKTLASDILVDYSKDIGHPFRKASFASHILWMFAEEKKITLDTLELGFNEADLLPEFRHYIAKSLSKDRLFFAKSLIFTFSQFESIVIDDVSTIEELEVIFKWGGHTYKIETDLPILKDRGWEFTPGLDDDLDEMELGSLDPHTFLPYGGYIHNNKEVSDLRREVVRVFNSKILEKIYI